MTDRAIATGAPRATPGGSGIHDLLLVLWMAFIAADRIDLDGHATGILLRPYLLLTPLVVISELQRRRAMGRPVALQRSAMAFLTLILLLMGIVAASVLASQETAVSAGRAVILIADVAGALAVVFAIADREDLFALLDRGAVAGVVVYALFDVAQLATLAGLLPQTLHVGPAEVMLMPSTYGGFIPRLSGMVIDQNRSGLALLFYGWWMAFRPGGRPRTGWLALVFVLMLLTLSRSGIVAALATWLVLVLERRVRSASPRFVFLAALACTALAGATVVSPTARVVVTSVLEPVAMRLSVDEGSSQAHLIIFERGLDVSTRSFSNLALGIGYGSAYTVLQDVFPGNRYGNFHSLYVTLLAECGIFALLTILVMLGVPIVRGGPLRALVVGVAVFNLFYQSTTDPAFWGVLALAWVTLPAAPRSRAAVPVRASSA